MKNQIYFLFKYIVYGHGMFSLFNCINNEYKIIIFSGAGSDNKIYYIEYKQNYSDYIQKQQWKLINNMLLPYEHMKNFSYNIIISNHLYMIIGGQINNNNLSNEIILLDFIENKIITIEQVYIMCYFFFF